MSDLFLIGKIIGFHGLKGEVKVLPSTNNLKLVSNIHTVTINLPDSKTITSAVNDIQLEKNLIRISFENYPSRTDAEILLNGEVFVTRDQLTSLDTDEWWVTDLVGLDVFTTSGALVGKVTSIIDLGNQLLEIKAANSEKAIMIPFVKALVPIVDLPNHRIEVSDLPGLLEPQ